MQVSTTYLSQHQLHEIEASAKNGPVIVTKDREPTFVLLSIEEYDRLKENQRSLIDILSVDDEYEVEFEPANI